MFHSARIKLTIYYLSVIMMVSGLFSVVIYQGVSDQVSQGYRQAEQRLKNQEKLHPEMRNIVINHDEIHDFFLQQLEASQKLIILRLLFINGVIFLMSTLLGFFFAGKTLQPIEEAHERQKNFIADASHELRTPITAMKTGLEVELRNKKIKKDVKDILESNLEEVNNLQSLTDYLLNLSFYQTSNRTRSHKKIDLKKIVDGVVKKLEPLVDSVGVGVISGSGGDYVVKGDKDALEELVTILLDNAIKYSHKNSEVIVSLSEKSGKVLLSIKDNGIGIDKKDLPFIFDRFYRADNSRTKSRKSGFGLGLALAKEIVEAHGADITVNSKSGKGSEFVIEFRV